MALGFERISMGTRNMIGGVIAQDEENRTYELSRSKLYEIETCSEVVKVASKVLLETQAKREGLRTRRLFHALVADAQEIPRWLSPTYSL